MFYWKLPPAFVCVSGCDGLVFRGKRVFHFKGVGVFALVGRCVERQKDGNEAALAVCVMS